MPTIVQERTKHETLPNATIWSRNLYQNFVVASNRITDGNFDEHSNWFIYFDSIFRIPSRIPKIVDFQFSSINLARFC